MELRPEVKEFAEQIEFNLRKHDPIKGDSYKEMDLGELNELMQKEYYEVLDADTPSKAIEELVDLGSIVNLCYYRISRINIGE